MPRAYSDPTPAWVEGALKQGVSDPFLLVDDAWTPEQKAGWVSKFTTLLAAKRSGGKATPVGPQQGELFDAQEVERGLAARGARRELPPVVRDVVGGAKQGLQDLYGMGLRAGEAVGRVADGVRRELSPAPDLDAQLAAPSGDRLVGSLERLGLVEPPAPPSAADELNRRQREEERVLELAGRGDAINDTLQTGLRGASRSLATAVPLAATGGGAAVVIGGFAASRANQAITEANDAGLTGSERAAYVGRAAAIEGGVAAVFQRLGLGGLEKALAGGAPTRATIMGIVKQTLAEVAEENVTEVADQINQEFSKVSGPLNTAQKLELLKQTTVTTLLTMGLAQGGAAVRGKFEREELAQGVASQYGWSGDRARAVVDRAADRKGDFNANLGQEVQDEVRLTPGGMLNFFLENETAARMLAATSAPSRKLWAQAGLPDRPAEERQRVAESLRGIVEAADQGLADRAAIEQAAAAAPPEAQVPGPAPAVEPPAPAQVEPPAAEEPLAPLPRPGGPLRQPTLDEARREGRGALTPEQQAQADELRARLTSKGLAPVAPDDPDAEGSVPDQRVRVPSKGLKVDWRTADAETLRGMLKRFEIPEAEHQEAERLLASLENPVPEGADWRTATDPKVIVDLFKTGRIPAEERAAAEERLVSLVPPFPGQAGADAPPAPKPTEAPPPPKFAPTGERIKTPPPAEKPTKKNTEKPAPKPATQPTAEGDKSTPSAAEKPPAQETKPEVKKPEKAGLKHVSEEKKARFEELKKRARKKFGQLNVGVDPELLAIGVEMTAIVVEDKVRGFAKYAQIMIGELGAKVRPHLRAWWTNVADTHELGRDMEEVTRAQAEKILAEIEDPAEDEGEETQAEEPPAPPEPKEEDFQAWARKLLESEEEPQAKGRTLRAEAKRRGLTEKDAQERVESVLVDMAREIVRAGHAYPTERQAFDALLALYERQPRLTERTSTSVLNQAYSTPVPLAYAASLMAGVDQSTTLYEPTAGMGALTIGADPAKTHVNELNGLRRSELAEKGFAKVTGEDATKAHPAELFDRMLANPPFGKHKTVMLEGGEWEVRKLEYLIAAEALRALKNDGQATLIFGAPLKEGEERTGRQRFLNYLLNNFLVAGNFEVAGELYAGQGAKWPVHVVVIAGRRAKSLGKLDLAPTTLERVGSWDDVWAKVEEVRAKAEQLRAGNEPAPDSPPPETPPPPKPEPDRPPEAPKEKPAERSKLEKALTTKPVLEGERANDRQRNYSPASLGKRLGTVVSNMLAPSTAKALTALRQEVGDVDAWLAGKLGYATVEELWKDPKTGAPRLAAEQVDGVALAIYNVERGGSLIIGDQTGIGKGRQAAALIAYAKAQGYMPVFLTADPKLFSDMYGDTLAIGKTVNPLLLGNTAKSHVKDKTHDVPAEDDEDAEVEAEEEGEEQQPAEEDDSKILVEALSTDRQKKVIEAHLAGKKSIQAAGFDAIFTTYSQLNLVKPKKGGPLGGVFDFGPRQKLMTDLVTRGKAFFVLDESHRASGSESDIGAFMRGGTVDKKKSKQDKTVVPVEFPGVLNGPGAKGVVYLSATFAKRPETMPLYFKTMLGKAAENTAALMNAFTRGGVALQQWAASALSEVGEMIRRERDFSGVRFETVSTAKSEEDKAESIRKVDLVAEALQGIVDFSRRAKDRIEAGNDKASSKVEMHLQTGDFSSVLHNYVSQLLLASKIDAAVEQAVASHRNKAAKGGNGEATVIVLSNTMESFLTDFARDNGLRVGERIDLTYADVLERALKRTMRTMRPDAGGKTEVVDQTAEDLGLDDEYDAVMELIGRIADLGLPVSPIDMLHSKLRKAGLRTGELTGRKLRLEYDDPLVTLTEKFGREPVRAMRYGMVEPSGIVGPRLRERSAEEINDKNAVVNAYQAGELDVVILNSSGATGISLHASEENPPAGQRPRHMVMAQPDLNIDVVKQAFGRILRTGMVGEAKDYARYTLLSLPVEAERRPFAVLAAKLASLSANTTAEAQDDVQVTSLDFLNKYGDEIVTNVLLEDESLSYDLGITPSVDEDGKVKVARGLAKRVTGKMAILANERQREFYDLVSRRYNERMKELIEAGEYDLEVEVQERWDAKLEESMVLEPATDPTNPFLSGLTLNRYSIVDPNKALKPNEIQELLVRQFGSKDPAGLATIAERQAGDYMAALAKKESAYVGPTPAEPGEDSTPEQEAAHAKETKELEERLKRVSEGRDAMRKHLGELAKLAGKSVQIATVSGEGKSLTTQEYTGTLVELRLEVPKKGNPYRLGLASAVVAVEASRRTVSFGLNRLKNETVKLEEIGPLNVATFGDNAPKGRVDRHVYTGNLVRAMDQAGRGQITTFRDAQGQAVTGLVMPAGWQFSDAEKDPRMNVLRGEAAANLLRRVGGAHLTATDAEGKATARLRIDRVGYDFKISVSAAKDKGGVVYLDKALLKIVGDFAGKTKMVAWANEPKIVEAVDHLIKQGFTFAANEATVEQVARAHGVEADMRMGSPVAAPAAASLSRGEPVPGGVQRREVVELIRSLWGPKLVSVRGSATFRKSMQDRKELGFYMPVYGEMRARDAYDVAVHLHELGHHFDRELGRWSMDKAREAAVARELERMGRDLYGGRVPNGGPSYYKSEGFAEFVRFYLFGVPDLQQKAPNVYAWWTTDYLAGNPEEAKRIRKLALAAQAWRTQAPGEEFDAFMRPTQGGFSAERVAATMASAEAAWVDATLPLLRAMQRTGADLAKVPPHMHPYMLAIFFARTAGGRTRHAVHGYQSDLYGREVGDSLRSVLAPVWSQGPEAIKAWKHYMVARRALEYYLPKGKNPGVSKEAALAIVREHENKPGFARTAEAFTDWAHQALRPLVESGFMTEEQFQALVDENPLYVSFMRRIDGEASGGGKGAPIHRVTGGSSAPIHDPIDALLMQYERVQAAAMQHEVLRAMVQFHDEHKKLNRKAHLGEVEVPFLAQFMSEVPPEKAKIVFSVEQIKAQVIAALRAAKDKQGAPRLDKQAVAAADQALEDAWDQQLAIYKTKDKADAGAGEDPIVGITINGKRRFFQIEPALLPILEGVTQTTFLRSELGGFVRDVTALQRLGATGLNARFSLVTNFLRDTSTAFVNADYGWHIPVVTSVMGTLEAIAETEAAKDYSAAGLGGEGMIGRDADLAAGLAGSMEEGRIGGVVRPLVRKVAPGLADVPFTTDVRSPWQALKQNAHALRQILSVTEAGPRIMEHKAALEEGRRRVAEQSRRVQAGEKIPDYQRWDERSARVLAGTASRDLTVNFSRGGTWSRKISEAVMFFGAGVQSINKVGRSFGAFEPLPWQKIQTRSGNLKRSAVRAAGMLTATAVLLYLKNRDDDDWKELPPHEKWGFLHVGKVGDSWIRVPLPFEVGVFFGALPIAVLEGPAAFKEALGVMFKGATPVDLGSWHAFARNFALLGPAADVLENKDWKGAPIVPEDQRHSLLERDQAGAHSTELARLIGAHAPGNGWSPAVIDHVLNGYTGGLWRRMAGMGDVHLDDPSTYWGLGALFTSPSTSRLVGDFYDRRSQLRKQAGSARIRGEELPLEERGELEHLERVSNALTKVWRERRAAVAAGAERREETRRLLEEAQALIRAHNKRPAGADRATGVAALVYDGTAPEAKPEDVRALRESGVSEAEAREALSAEARRRGDNARPRLPSGRLTAFGERQARLFRALR